MATDKNDILIKQFFQENKKEIADNHFTEKVMRRLPEKKKNYEWIVVIFAGLGTLLSIILKWDYQLPELVITLPASIPIYYLLAAMFAIPFVVLLFSSSLKNIIANWI